MVARNDRGSEMKDEVLRTSAKIIREMRECLRQGKKIQAIKTLRSDTNCGLREAKLAVERYDAEHSCSPNSQIRGVQPDAMKIVSRAFIKSVSFDLGSGDGSLSVDLEAMEMHALMGLDTMGIDEISRILDLVKILKAFSEGAIINVDRALEDGSYLEDALE